MTVECEKCGSDHGDRPEGSVEALIWCRLAVAMRDRLNEASDRLIDDLFPPTNGEP